ncbi:MAG: phosphate ABC transporter substrate-binding protein PstS [Solirubrobacterales bacterium]|nr:phosphate ABC transporter substrate-binding protein PstS [Solirubrobacterales bacterium]
MATKLIRKGSVLLAVAASLGLAACGSSSGGSGSSSSSSKNLTGAGSTLVAPIMSQWQSKYDQLKGVTVTYGAIGSGGGIAQITARTVDFGASDAPMTTNQAASCKSCLQIPWALAATAIAYHVTGVTNGLKLTGPVLSDIWLGKVKTWNDPAIAKLNPGVKLPSTKITPVYRTDGSGDTYAFTNYLSHISPQWKSQVGTSTQVHFPVGLGGKGNSGVGGVLSSTNGSIAYIAIAYVTSNHFDDAAIQNAAGKFVAPDVSSITAAGATATSIPSNNAISIVDPPASAPAAYPISTFTYAIVPTKSPKANELKPFFDFAISAEGQKYGPALEFGTMPARVVSAATATIAKIHS